MSNFFDAKYLVWHILIALVLAFGVGTLLNLAGTTEGQTFWLNIFQFFGGLFMSALKMIVIPLVLSAVVVGVASMAGQNSFGRIGAKTIGFYVLTGFIAIGTGLVLVNVIQPGNVDEQVAAEVVAFVEGVEDDALVQKLERTREISDTSGLGSLFDIITRAVPPNIFVALTDNSALLAIIFVGVVVGFFTTRLTGEIRQTMDSFWTGVYEVMILITLWIIRFAPIGVFALVAGAVTKLGAPSLLSLLMMFALTVLLGLAIHFFVWLPLLLRFAAGVNPLTYYSKVARAQLMAFSTASSSATLPVTIQSAENAGLSKSVSSFVLPLGATVNMDGTALFECVVVIFIAQIYFASGGDPISITDQITVVILALLTSIGVAGIPGASMVAIVLILSYLGLPVEWYVLILAIDRILDMCRTSTNVTGDLTIAALVARSEGEELEQVRSA